MLFSESVQTKLNSLTYLPRFLGSGHEIQNYYKHGCVPNIQRAYYFREKHHIVFMCYFMLHNTGVQSAESRKKSVVQMIRADFDELHFIFLLLSDRTIWSAQCIGRMQLMCSVSSLFGSG